jgi:hypothetical protein
MGNTGLAYRGHLGIGLEDTFGTRIDPDAYINILQESIKYTLERHVPGDIISSPFRKIEVAGNIVVAGGFSFEANGVNLGWPLKAGFTSLTSAANTNIAGTPTATPAAGGTLADGAYKYKVSPIFAHTASGLNFLGELSTEFEGTAAAPNSTLTIAWAANPTPASGFTYAGTAVFRTAVGGGADTQKYLDAVIGAGLSYSDTGGTALSTMSPPSAVYSHTCINNDGDLSSFTIEACPDLANSRWALGMTCSSLKLDLPEPGKPITCALEFTGQDEITTTAKTSPAFTSLAPFMTHKAYAYLQTQGGAYTANVKLNKFDLTNPRVLEIIRSFTGNGKVRAIRTGEIGQVSGSFSLTFEDYTEYNRVASDTAMSLAFIVIGPYTGTFTQTKSATTFTAWPYMLKVVIPNMYYEVAQANLSNRAQIIENVPYKAIYDTTTTSDLQIVAYNTTASYT